jgi:ribonuclease III
MSAGLNLALLRQLAGRLEIDFGRIEWLGQALTHKSFANEAAPVDGVEHNERMEFLGDAVLNLLVGEMLMHAHPQASEGLLSQMRAALVNGEVLAEEAERLGLGEALRLGRGEERTGGRKKASILADAFEAVVAAAYLDGGLEVAAGLVRRCLAERIAGIMTEALGVDSKSRLQEHLQAMGHGLPEYRLVDSTGPDHDRRFQVEVHDGDALIGAGRGRSKKLAEQNAAADALRSFRPPEEQGPDVEPES